ncbi:unnamed protein product [Laminaria digitata]
MSSIWSRAFDYLRQAPDGSSLSRRAMVPVVNAANHDPSVSPKERGTLRVVAGRDYKAREQFYLLYGRYSNAKLLYR